MEVLSIFWIGFKALVSSIAAAMFLAVAFGVCVGVLLWFGIWVAGLFDSPNTKKDSGVGDAVDSISDLFD